MDFLSFSTLNMPSTNGGTIIQCDFRMPVSTTSTSYTIPLEFTPSIAIVGARPIWESMEVSGTRAFSIRNSQLVAAFTSPAEITLGIPYYDGGGTSVEVQYIRISGAALLFTGHQRYLWNGPVFLI